MASPVPVALWRIVPILAIFFCLTVPSLAAAPSGSAAGSRKEATDRIARGAQASADGGQVPDHSVITGRNLFGLPAGGKGPEPAADDPQADLPATSLDLVLMGIVDGGSRDRRAVILSKKDHVQQLYQVGDRVAGAQIRRILWGKVILRTDGGDEVLDMSEAASYRSTEKAAPADAPAHLASAVSPQAEDAAPADSWEADDRLIPEKVRLVLPDQESTEVENGGQGDAEKGE